MMRIKKSLLLLLLLFTFLLPLQAKQENKSIFIASKQLPFVLHVQTKNDKQMEIRFIPTDMLLPIRCQNEPSTLKQLNLLEDIACARNSVEAFFSLPTCDNTLYLHLDRLVKDLKVPYQNVDFYNLKDITSYFSKLLKKMNIKFLLKYNSYVDSDLSLSDYYHYYKLFKGKKIKLTYFYVNQIQLDDLTLPMEAAFQPLKHK